MLYDCNATVKEKFELMSELSGPADYTATEETRPGPNAVPAA